MKESDTQYLLGLTLIPGLGAVRIKLLLDHLGTARDIWNLTDSQISVLKLPSDVRDSLVTHRKKIDLAKEMQLISSSGVHLLPSTDAQYPALLKDI